MMGAVTFSIDVDLMHRLKRALPLSVFVETGTYEGDSLALALPLFPSLHSIEVDADFYARACSRFRDQPNVRLYHDESPARSREAAAGARRTISTVLARRALVLLGGGGCKIEVPAAGGAACDRVLERPERHADR
jgi:hypothetical protein